MGKTGTHLEDPILERTASRHADGPAELRRLDVGSNPFSIFVVGQRLEPVANRFPPKFAAVEDRREPFALRAIWQIRHETDCTMHGTVAFFENETRSEREIN